MASYLGKQLRDRFGKGPESVYVSSDSCFVTLHIRNFLGPVEKFLLSKQEEKAFRYTRELLMKSLLPELSDSIRETLGLEVEELYYDWGIYNSSGVIVGVAKGSDWVTQFPDYKGKKELHEQINRVSAEVQKWPEMTNSYWMNPRTLIVMRRGILIKIEKELISLGFEEDLKITKRKLEKRHLAEETAVGELFGKTVSDIYVDWDFSLDTSAIVYTFQD
ncbi:Na-translocating system protein MpsC family protein [Paenibacillus aurantius]|uniref:Na-translocating system protein MpsC family protein n=1 Tax=Paenibacillus aurantius TaxID=2918900 RepID=A0AA96RDJ8_9BACL|nr:Na-translocating system protein MpsC family protein [Paenibacillus aurantius]WNQ09178.1 Na-translocating system protein MpsC family protein [Paenibacillus aurantius]